MSTKLEEERRKEEEKIFLDLCSEGDLETVKTFLAEDPSLINSKDPEKGKLFHIQIMCTQKWFTDKLHFFCLLAKIMYQCMMSFDFE